MHSKRSIILYRKESRIFLRLVIPFLIGLVTNCAMSLVDTLMAGMAGTIEISGVALGVSFTLPATLFVISVASAITPTVSYLLAKMDFSKIHSSFFNSMIAGLILSIIVTFILFQVDYIFEYLPSDPKMEGVAKEYIYYVALGTPAIFILGGYLSLVQGLGISRLNLYIGIIQLCLNIPLNYIFVFGKFGFPALGGAGCGLTTALIYIAASIIVFIYVKYSKLLHDYRSNYSINRIQKDEIVSFLKLGIPIGFARTIEITGFSLAAIILSPFGSVIMAAHTITINISGVIYMIPLSIGMAATIRISYAMGKQDWDMIKRIIKIGAALNLSLFLLYFTALLCLREQIASIFINDDEVIALTVSLMLFNCIYMLPDCLQCLFNSILQGFKDSKTILWGMISSYWIVGLPLASVLAWGLIGPKMHAYGIWIGFIFALTVAAVIFAGRTFYIVKNKVVPKLYNEQSC